MGKRLSDTEALAGKPLRPAVYHDPHEFVEGTAERGTRPIEVESSKGGKGGRSCFSDTMKYLNKK